ncbi:hypothetical protein EI427_09495 [Flammeovirga pectinis]|uniref:Uncharacterized protein n=1 Tax=Flammeovirga pectinis TaxID=2494373 RepID=A0A3Q9FKW2_9BACT|nr:hypothetical protein [Flammeovirga pectinis]AZQ62464.1 hypothetical protein EI427_09495 [Flammeovirga pectinis]
MKKTLKRNDRLKSAKIWMKIYPGKNLIKGYANKYAVDKITAIKELRMIGVEISREYEKQLVNAIERNKLNKLSKKDTENELNAFSEFSEDENYAMVIGYTSNGVPYGITFDELNQINNKS